MLEIAEYLKKLHKFYTREGCFMNLNKKRIEKKLVNIDYILLILGVLSIILLRKNGLLSSDSNIQLFQAKIGYYNDWHPVIMGFIWFKLNNFFKEIDSLYYFHLIVFFLGIWNIIYFLRKKSIVLSVCFVLIVFLVSFRGNLLFYIWKDTGMYVIYLFIIGISLNLKNSLNKYIKFLLIIFSILLLTYSISIRSNSIFSGFIMLILIFYSSGIKILKTVIFALVVWILVILSNNYFTYKYLNTKKLYPLKYIMISDIYQINYRKNKNIPNFLKGKAYSIENERIAFEDTPNINKYVHYKLINLVGNSLINGIDIKNIQKQEIENYKNIYQNLNEKEILENYNFIKSYWFNLIKENPIIFLKIKIKFFINLVGGCSFILLMTMNLILQYFYSFKKKRIKQLLIYLSSCFYLWPYFIFNPSYDYRYVAYCILVEIFMFIYVIYNNFEDISKRILTLKRNERKLMEK